MELISKSIQQFKANLHAHSTLSDGGKTPEELKKLYQEAGYQILAITDHEVPWDHSALSEPGFLMLTGYEAYIRNHPKYDPFGDGEIHLNLFAKQPDNVRFICFNPGYTKYAFRHKSPEEFQYVGSQETRRCDRAYIQKFIDTAKENGYLVAYNHPYWSFEDESEIFAHKGCFSVEIRNGSSWSHNRLEYNAGLYDRMLRKGMRIFCHAGDDNHNHREPGDPLFDSFLAWTQICAEELSYPAVIKAMEAGHFYASSGPKINSLSYEDGSFHIETSPAAHIVMYFGSRATQSVHAAAGSFLTTADFTLPERAAYARFTVFDEKGNTADTRGYFRDELE